MKKGNSMNDGICADLTKEIIGAAIEVHRVLGPGLLESVYESCLISELKQRHLDAVNQVGIPIVYKGIKLDENLRIDILVNDIVIIELKSVNNLLPIHEAQVLTYMKLAKKRVGLLINFNSNILVNGIKRLVI